MPGLTPGGSYNVRLDFAEIFFASPGQRVFNVAINGAAVLKNFDIVATTGGIDLRAPPTTFHRHRRRLRLLIVHRLHL